MANWQNLSIAQLPASGIRAISDRAKCRQDSGRRVFQLALGRPDIDTPLHIKKAAIAALEEGMVHYAPTSGIPMLREALASTLSQDLGWEVDPDSEVLVTAGASEALFVAMVSTLNPGDQVLVGEHSWLNYPAIARILGAEPVYYRMPVDLGFEPDLDDIRSKLGKRTRMLVVNSPTNPTGAVFSKETVHGLASLAIEGNLLVLSDECYRKIIFPGAHHISPASVSGMRERTIYVDSFSKTYSMTGWRLGYIVAPSSIMPSITKAHQFNCGSACSFGQVAAAVALTSSQACVESSQLEFRRRRDLVLRHLASIPNIECRPPMGTFYVYPSIRRMGLTSLDLSLWLLEMTGVAVVPGSVFGPAGEGHFRISCTVPLDELDEAMTLMSGALADLASRP